MRNCCKTFAGVLISDKNKTYNFFFVFTFLVLNYVTYFSRFLILYMRKQENEIRTGTRASIYCNLRMCQKLACIVSLNLHNPLRQVQYETGIIMKNYVMLNCNVPYKCKIFLTQYFLHPMSVYSWACWLSSILRWMHRSPCIGQRLAIRKSLHNFTWDIASKPHCIE